MPSSRSHLPRLPRESYQGLTSVHWTLCLQDRITGWRNDRFHASFREVMLHTCARHECICAAYCLMPDHIHLLLIGVNEEADLYQAAQFLRQHLEPALKTGTFQKQAYDHILRDNERTQDAFAQVCHYILENPVRAGLSDSAADYAFSGSIIPGYPDLQIHARGYWDLYWQIHHRLITKPSA